VTAERYTAVFTGRFTEKNPGEYPYLTMGEDPLGPEGSYAFRRGRPPYERLGRGLPFTDLPEGCRRLVLDTYRRLWGLRCYRLDHQGHIAHGTATQEATMDFNLDDAQQYLEGADFGSGDCPPLNDF
jgi:hypothetical protein